MSTFAQIADKTSTICVGTLAMALGDYTGGGAAVASGVGGLAALGLAINKNRPENASAKAVQQTIKALKDTPEFADANFKDVARLLSKTDGHASLTHSEVLEAHKGETPNDRINALVDLLIAKIPVQDEDPLTISVLRQALTASMTVCYNDADLKEQIERELLTDIARGVEGIESQVDEIPDKVVAKLIELGFVPKKSAEDGLNLQKLRALALEYGDDAPETTPEIVNFLTEIAADYKRIKLSIKALPGHSERLTNLAAAASEALERRDRKEARRLLLEAKDIQKEVRREALETDAALSVQIAEIDLLDGRAEEAFRLLSEAADSFAVLDALEPVRRRVKYEDILFSHGLRYGGQGMKLSAQMLQDAIGKIEKNSAPDLWANAQNNLGLALQNQGARTDEIEGTDLVACAVAAYEDALSVYTKTDHPAQWAMTKNNLGTALKDQGTSTDGAQGTDLLARAVAAYEDAQSVYIRTDHPVDWAMTKNNLGIALRIQGIRTDGAQGTDLLARAVAAYEDALSVYTKTEHPLDWARTKNNLGSALATQGNRTDGAQGIDLLARAVTAYEDALSIRTKTDHPVEWAMTRNNMALLEELRSDHNSTTDPIPHFRAALDHVEAALCIFDPEHMPYDHAKATALRDRLQARLAE